MGFFIHKDDCENTQFKLHWKLRARGERIFSTATALFLAGVLTFVGVQKHNSNHQANFSGQDSSREALPADYFTRDYGEKVVGDFLPDPASVLAQLPENLTIERVDGNNQIISRRSLPRVYINNVLASSDSSTINHVKTPKQFDKSEEKVQFASYTTGPNYEPKVNSIGKRCLLQEETLEKSGIHKNEKGIFSATGNSDGKNVRYNIGSSSDSSSVYGIRIFDNGEKIDFVADRNGIVEIPGKLLGKRTRLIAGNSYEGKVEPTESVKINLYYENNNLAEGPKLSSLERSLDKYEIVDKAFWTEKDSLEANVANYSIKNKNLGNEGKYKFDRNKFSNTENYDSFKEDYLNGEKSLKEIADNYGMSASTASILGRDVFGGRSRKESRMINGVYATKRNKRRNKKSYSIAA